MGKLRISLGCWNYDRTRALMDGSVGPDGIDLNYLNMPVEETFFRMLRYKEFEAAEMSRSCYTDSLLDGGGSGRGERIREGMKAKAAKGLGLGRPPFGYRLQVDGTLKIDPGEAEIVRSIFRMYTEPRQGVRVGLGHVFLHAVPPQPGDDGSPPPQRERERGERRHRHAEGDVAEQAHAPEIVEDAGDHR